MAPARLQCINATRILSKSSSSLQAAFSSSRKAYSDERRPVESTPRSFPPSYQNPIPVQKRATSSANQGLMNLINQSTARAQAEQQALRERNRKASDDNVLDNGSAVALSKQIHRRWRVGDVYAPHDLSGREMAKWKARGRPEYDVFDVLDFNPLDHYRNFSVMSEYMTEMGRIKHSKITGLRPVNQRKIAKAIRRSIGLGLMPSVHRHPELLQDLAQRTESRNPSRASIL